MMSTILGVAHEHFPLIERIGDRLADRTFRQGDGPLLIEPDAELRPDRRRALLARRAALFVRKARGRRFQSRPMNLVGGQFRQSARRLRHAELAAAESPANSRSRLASCGPRP